MSQKYLILIILGVVVVVLFFLVSPYFLFEDKQTYNQSSISFQYLKGWNFSTDDLTDNKILTGSNGYLVFAVYETPENDLNLSIKSEMSAGKTIGTIKDNGNIQIDGVPGYQITVDAKGVGFKTVLFNKGGHNYKLLFTGDTFSYRRSIDTIINTFHVE